MRHGARCDAPPGSIPRQTPKRLHAVRKAGRRLRYAAEAVTEEPVVLFGKRARALARGGEDLHDVLGDHRDEMLFAEHVRRVAAHAAHAGAPGRRPGASWPSKRIVARLSGSRSSARPCGSCDARNASGRHPAEHRRNASTAQASLHDRAIGFRARDLCRTPHCSNIVTVPWKSSSAGVFSRADGSTA